MRLAIDAAMNYNDPLVHLILDSIPHLLFVKDENSVFLYANPALLGIYPPERRTRVIGYTTAEQFSPEEAETFLEEDRKALLYGESSLVEEITTYDGARRVFNTRKIAFAAGDGRKCLLGISTDITELASREEELVEANQSLQNFSAFAAHDFRAPLASYVTSLECICSDRSSVLSEGSRKKIDSIIDSASSLSRGLGSLLRTSKAARLGTAIERAPCDINLVLSKLRFDLSHALQSTRFRIYASRFPMLMVDEALIRQLFQNLIENSIKYRNRSCLSRVKFLYLQRTDFHRIVVEDNGIGISPAHAGRVFTLYDQGDRKGFDGAGMGLALCKRIVSLHGGTIMVDRDFGTGCRFVIDLPFDAGTSLQQVAQPAMCVHATAGIDLALVD